MKVKTVYECEKCGQGYDNEEMCKEWDLLSRNKSKQEDKEEDIEL